MGADRNLPHFHIFPHAQVRYKNKTLLIIKHLQKEPWFSVLSEKLRKESDFRQNIKLFYCGSNIASQIKKSRRQRRRVSEAKN